jgi:hypothetical protein
MKTNRKENRYVDGKIEKIKLIVCVSFFFFASEMTFITGTKRKKTRNHSRSFPF